MRIAALFSFAPFTLARVRIVQILILPREKRSDTTIVRLVRGKSGNGIPVVKAAANRHGCSSALSHGWQGSGSGSVGRALGRDGSRPITISGSDAALALRFSSLDEPCGFCRRFEPCSFSLVAWASRPLPRSRYTVEILQTNGKKLRRHSAPPDVAVLRQNWPVGKLLRRQGSLRITTGSAIVSNGVRLAYFFWSNN